MGFCAACGEVWTSRRADARYCSATCRQRGHRSKTAFDETADCWPTNGPRTAVDVFRPSGARTEPKPAPAPALGPRDSRTGRVIDVKALIG